MAVLRGALAATYASEAAARAEGREQDAARLALEACQVRPGWWSRQAPVGCCAQNIPERCGVSWPCNAIPCVLQSHKGAQKAACGSPWDAPCVAATDSWQWCALALASLDGYFWFQAGMDQGVRGQHLP